MTIIDSSPLNTPAVWVNQYLRNKLSNFGFDGVAFFPTQPSSIDDITQRFSNNDLGIMATYDRMFKMNRKSFPHIKCEQLLYYFYATQQNSVLNMVKVTEIVYRLLDRFDESAEEVNNWCSNRIITVNDNINGQQSEISFNNIFYFHNFRVYQLEETRDIIDFGTARTYAGNKIIIEFDYHQKPIIENNENPISYTDWKPEKLNQKEELI